MIAVVVVIRSSFVKPETGKSVLEEVLTFALHYSTWASQIKCGHDHNLAWISQCGHLLSVLRPNICISQAQSRSQREPFCLLESLGWGGLTHFHISVFLRMVRHSFAWISATVFCVHNAKQKVQGGECFLSLCFGSHAKVNAWSIVRWAQQVSLNVGLRGTTVLVLCEMCSTVWKAVQHGCGCLQRSPLCLLNHWLQEGSTLHQF